MNLSEQMAFDASRVTALIDRYLAPKAGMNHAKLYEAMRYSALAGGKRLRPHLTYEFCRLCGGEDAQADAYAASIEMLHTYSLIHDDLPAMDDDNLRRGKPTNHVVFGEATAILAGDALLTESMSIMANNAQCSDAQNLYAVIALTEAAGMDGMVGGQQIDLQSCGKKLDAPTLSDMHMRKTGAIITCACMCGCIAANADRDKINASGEFGSCIGLAFQIVDDVLDLTSTTDDMGKTVGKDGRDDKTTFASLLGVREARAAAKELTEKAKSCLSAFEPSDTLERLYDLCDYIVARKN